MTTATARARLSTTLSETGGESVTVALDEKTRGTSVWEFSLCARMRTGRAHVATWRSAPCSVSGAPPSRLQAVATVPSAQGYELTVSQVSGAAREVVEVLLETQRLSGGSAGFQLVDSTSSPVAAPVPASLSAYDYAAGAAGVVNVPAGAKVLRWSAHCAGAGATAQVGAGAVVALPNGGAVQGEPSGCLVGPVALTFALTAGYLVEWES